MKKLNKKTILILWLSLMAVMNFAILVHLTIAGEYTTGLSPVLKNVNCTLSIVHCQLSIETPPV